MKKWMILLIQMMRFYHSKFNSLLFTSCRLHGIILSKSPGCHVSLFRFLPYRVRENPASFFFSPGVIEKIYDQLTGDVGCITSSNGEVIFLDLYDCINFI